MSYLFNLEKWGFQVSSYSLGPAGKYSPKPHATLKDVTDISLLDRTVRITGVVVESTSSYVVVDDGTGTIKVLLPSETSIPEVGKIVRVFGSVHQNGKGSVYINAEIIQDMSSLNLELYSKVKKIKKLGLT